MEFLGAYALWQALLRAVCHRQVPLVSEMLLATKLTAVSIKRGRLGGANPLKELLIQSWGKMEETERAENTVVGSGFKGCKLKKKKELGWNRPGKPRYLGKQR